MDQVEEDLKRMKIIGRRAKVEDRQEWNRIVEQTQDPPRVVESIEEEKFSKLNRSKQNIQPYIQ
jgi:hypothetical protein